MTRLYHITYNQYETNMTLLTKKGHMCFILKIARTRRIRNWPSFFSEHRSICSNILFHLANMIYTKRDTYYRGQTWHWSFWVRLCSLQNEQFQQNGQFHHSNVKLLVLISNLPFHSDWLRQMSGFRRGYQQKKMQQVPTFLFPWLNYCSITLWAQNIGECWSQYHSWPLSYPIFAVHSIAHKNVFSFVYMAASQAASSTL